MVCCVYMASYLWAVIGHNACAGWYDTQDEVLGNRRNGQRDALVMT